MRNPAVKLTLASTILACAFSILNAQEMPSKTPASASAMTAPPSFKQAVMYQLGDTEKKLVDLAEAVPEEKYSWRPAPGVRSIGEALMHEAGANVFFMTFLGTKPPAGFRADGEKTVTAKADIVAALKASFAHVRTVVSAISDEDLNKPTKMMGRPATNQTVLFFFSDHMHEHLGQLIAYARMNGVVPPWSKGKEN